MVEGWSATSPENSPTISTLRQEWWDHISLESSLGLASMEEGWFPSRGGSPGESRIVGQAGTTFSPGILGR